MWTEFLTKETESPARLLGRLSLSALIGIVLIGAVEATPAPVCAPASRELPWLAAGLSGGHQADRSDSSSGLAAYKDAASDRFTVPTRAELSVLSLPGLESRSGARGPIRLEERAVEAAAGGTEVVFDGRFRSMVRAVRQPDGSLALSCKGVKPAAGSEAQVMPGPAGKAE